MAESKANATKGAASAAPKVGHFVAAPFRDRDDFTKEYNIGDDVSHLGEGRLEDLISKGLVELK